MQTAAIDRPATLAYRIVRSLRTNDWHVLDPVGGAVCRAEMRARAEEIARALSRLRAERDARPGC